MVGGCVQAKKEVDLNPGVYNDRETSKKDLLSRCNDRDSALGLLRKALKGFVYVAQEGRRRYGTVNAMRDAEEKPQNNFDEAPKR